MSELNGIRGESWGMNVRRCQEEAAGVTSTTWDLVKFSTEICSKRSDGSKAIHSLEANDFTVSFFLATTSQSPVNLCNHLYKDIGQPFFSRLYSTLSLPLSHSHTHSSNNHFPHLLTALISIINIP